MLLKVDMHIMFCMEYYIFYKLFSLRIELYFYSLVNTKVYEHY
jgi:hypothetical protein